MTDQCQLCRGTGWTHHTACMGWFTTAEERDAIGHCLEDCGSSECYKVCDCHAVPAAHVARHWRAGEDGGLRCRNGTRLSR